MSVKDGLLLPGADTSELVKKARVVEAGTALKTVLESGFYRLQDNYPDAPAQFPPDWGQMIVSRSSDTIAQMIFDAFSSRMVFRTGRSIGHAVEAWEEWKEVVTKLPDIPLTALTLLVGTPWENVDTLSYRRKNNMVEISGLFYVQPGQLPHSTLIARLPESIYPGVAPWRNVWGMITTSAGETGSVRVTHDGELIYFSGNINSFGGCAVVMHYMQ